MGRHKEEIMVIMDDTLQMASKLKGDFLHREKCSLLECYQPMMEDLKRLEYEKLILIDKFIQDLLRAHYNLAWGSDFFSVLNRKTHKLLDMFMGTGLDDSRREKYVEALEGVCKLLNKTMKLKMDSFIKESEELEKK